MDALVSPMERAECVLQMTGTVLAIMGPVRIKKYE